MLTAALLLLQAQEADAWPDGTNEWLGAAVALLAIIGAVAGLIRSVRQNAKMQQAGEDAFKNLEKKHDADMIRVEKEMIRLADDLRKERAAMLEKLEIRFTQHGVRLGEVEAGCNANGATLQEMKGTSFEVSTNTREVSRLDGQLTALEKTFDAHLKEANSIEAALRERMAVIETKLGMRPRSDRSA